MLRYVAGRLGQALLVLWAAYTVSFFVLWALPSDPVSLLLGTDPSDVTPEQLAAVRHEYGLDQPLLVQYVHQLGDVLHGDLGRSVSTRQPVTTLLGDAIGPTAQIAAAGLLLAVLLGGGLAVAATLTRNRRLAGTLLGLPPLGVAVPGFWFGLVLLQCFSFRLPLFPAIGDDGLASIVLPAVTLALPTGAVIAQLLSKSLTAALREPYAETARAKGASPARVHLRHALRNASLPALTAAGLLVGGLLGGTVVTETVFSRPGLGRLTATAVQSQDVPVVQGVVLVGATVFVLVNLAVDLVYPVLDPRVEQWRRRRTPRGHGTPAAVPQPA
ncbi:ABC transporter permease [Luteimicrobium subarcticum]|uniref:Peptide/nickel transport system permease protein n=1 Tax=Luteimicrobium subarcticum TaxID=620910 RepID=A0A2M8WSB9_9MICO|nr:ABC transporter permease [Luteimicrobium subarcticum]PJI93829.1 peptide/nickel transport system permease protein [Luteimicrobium subarcticum]